MGGYRDMQIQIIRHYDDQMKKDGLALSSGHLVI